MDKIYMNWIFKSRRLWRDFLLWRNGFWRKHFVFSTILFNLKDLNGSAG